MDTLHPDYLRAILSYDPMTGIFTWKYRVDVGKKWNTRFSGKEAGGVSSLGYHRIVIKKKLYYSHRLAWVMTHNEWPTNEIDHIDCDRLNNRISNLRLATHQENMQNVCLLSTNKSGVKGVHWCSGRKKWAAAISFENRIIPLGRFDSFQEARNARKSAEIKFFSPFRRAV